METFAFECRGGASSAAIYRGEGARCTLILAHGAGAPRTHPWMVRMATEIASRGFDVVTFNFLYAEARRKVPDRNETLEATWLSAIDAVRAREDLATGRVFLGGKSMGGRIATQVAAGGAGRYVDDLAGLVLLGYPLHPPGKPEKLRSAHLPLVRAPMLFVQGERDAFGTKEEMAAVVAGLSAGTRLFVVEGGDHSLARPRASGESQDQTLARVAEEVARFMA